MQRPTANPKTLRTGNSAQYVQLGKLLTLWKYLFVSFLPLPNMAPSAWEKRILHIIHYAAIKFTLTQAVLQVHWKTNKQTTNWKESTDWHISPELHSLSSRENLSPHDAFLTFYGKWNVNNTYIFFFFSVPQKESISGVLMMHKWTKE